ncbi:hypothetical protein [Knoellia sp. p5-6-4]|uniref:hypothetical protein n=1 Tax=unclassified Knoellia TaxID=2618719 RepID=UPI0023DA686F|nr:hypothetical protein [Knoellia sp. p5-6-4]MDF2143810.1 hypothetical protein [Knoellia sp. p5-6-4]
MASERPLDSIDACYERQREILAREEGQQWVHHLADLSGDRGVETTASDRPLTDLARQRVLADSLGPLLLWPLELPERSLTARHPYESAPLSFVNAVGRSWSVWAEGNRLEWAEDTGADRRYGGLVFWFRDVEPGREVLVTVSAKVGTPAGATGSVEVRADSASPRSFPVTGFASHTFDLLLRPSDAFGTRVDLEIRAGVSYFAFSSVRFNRL